MSNDAMTLREAAEALAFACETVLIHSSPVARDRATSGLMEPLDALRAALAENPPAVGEWHCEGCRGVKLTLGADRVVTTERQCKGIPAAQPAVSAEELDNIDEILKHDHSHWNKNYDAYRRMQILGATVARLRGEGK